MGVLPIGLAFDRPAGRIHGTPTVEESQTFTVRVDDAIPSAAERQLTLRVCNGGDGVNSCDNDCDDTAPDRFPGNPGVCDGKDNDCDTVIDSGLDGDGDGDGVDDLCDNCPTVSNSAQTDSEDDGFGNACDDFDPAAWAGPGPAHSVIYSVVKEVISWNEPMSPGSLGGLQYDVIRSSNAGDFVSTAVCVESDDGTDRTAFDATHPPAPWKIYYYLIRSSRGGRLLTFCHTP